MPRFNEYGEIIEDDNENEEGEGMATKKVVSSPSQSFQPYEQPPQPHRNPSFQPYESQQQPSFGYPQTAPGNIPTQRTNMPLFVMSGVFVLAGLITFIAVVLLLTRNGSSDNNSVVIEVTSVPTDTPVVLVVTATPDEEEQDEAEQDEEERDDIRIAEPEPEPEPELEPEPEPEPTDTPVPPAIEQPYIISRSAWGASTPDGSSGSQVPYRILLSHDGQDARGSDPVVLIQRIQRLHKDRWVDIAWHYIVDLDGNIYEGRNPNDRTNSGYIPNTDGMIVIGVLGDYDSQMPSQRQIDAITHLMAWLCDEYNISSEEIYPFRDFARQTDPNITSPGRNFDMSNIRGQVRDLLGYPGAG